MKRLINFDKICSIDGCSDGAKTKWLCRKHYERQRRINKGICKNITVECLMKDCIRGTRTHIYCQMHRNRLNPFKKQFNKGINNGMWRGGIAEYPNHYEMKKVRKIKLELVGNNCEECDIAKPSNELQMHHMDGSKDNHVLENFKLLCRKCHASVYHKDSNKK